jgi:hypothetical protein
VMSNPRAGSFLSSYIPLISDCVLVNSRLAAILVALAFVSGAFVSSPELRATAATAIISADIVDGTIKSVDTRASKVKTSDIGNDHVTSAKIKDGNVMTSELANSAVTSDKLANGAVTLAQLGSCVVIHSSKEFDSMKLEKSAAWR